MYIRCLKIECVVISSITLNMLLDAMSLALLLRLILKELRERFVIDFTKCRSK